MEILKKLLPFILVIVLSVGVLLPLTHNGFFPMHDDEQIARLYDLDQAVRSGNFPPRIAPNLGFGYGYPFFNYYPSFAYYVGEVYHLIGFNLIISTKLMLVTGFLVAAIGMYLFAKEFFGKVAGIVAAVAYTYASYHAVDVYVRGAFAEFYAFVFLPFVFLGLYKLSKDRKWRYVVLTVLSLGGFILSHQLIVLMSAPFIGGWALYLLLTSKQKIRLLMWFALSFVLGMGITSYFWLPSYFERNLTLVNILTSELANYSLHFVCVHQLWNSPWGYGGSIPSCYDGITFEIGKIQILASVIAVVLSVLYATRKKLRSQTIPIMLFGFFLALSSFMMVKYSKPVWDFLPPLWYVQFPWRYLLISAFISSFLTSSVVWFIKNEKLRIAAAGIFIVLIIAFSISYFSPQRYFNVTDADYTNTEKIRWETSSLAYEYVPRGVQTKKSKIGTTLVNINKNEIATSAAQVKTGTMVIDTLTNLPQYKKLTVTVSNPGILRINTFSFPGWTVFVNQKQTAYTDKNKLKLIELPLDSGSYVVEVKFLDTPVRTIGNVVSLISIIVVVGGSVYAYTRKKHGKA